MSVNLYSRPVIKEPQGNCIGYQLKFHLAPKLWGNDGTLHSDWVVVNSDLIPFLEGLESAGSSEVKIESNLLIQLINKYGEVELSLK